MVDVKRTITEDGKEQLTFLCVVSGTDEISDLKSRVESLEVDVLKEAPVLEK